MIPFSKFTKFEKDFVESFRIGKVYGKEFCTHFAFEDQYLQSELDNHKARQYAFENYLDQSTFVSPFTKKEK